MIGIVVVSHSPRLAHATVELAMEMVQGDPPPISIAAGAGDDVIGTDATRVAAAIDEVASPDGVLVFMDLGSAVLSSTMALEFVRQRAGVRLTDAPFVEGLIAAVALASAGAGLDEVESEARSALDAKRGQLGLAPAAPTAASDEPGSATAEFALINPAGLHARPAAAFAKAAAAFDATITVRNVTDGKGPVAAPSLVGIMSLGAKQGDVVRVDATGPQAAEAISELSRMASEGFGELG